MRARLVLMALLAAGLGLVPRTASAQAATGFLALRFDPEPLGSERFPRPPLPVDGRYIVIRLEENRLYLMDGEEVAWSAPVATGNGFRLDAGAVEWHFATPRGVFRVQRREKDPVWIKPDWAYIEEGKPIPPIDSPARRQEGMLGTSAVYIGYELAMHGTDKPELVLSPNPDDRRVSHGCIRLTNEDARALYHRVEVGMPVLIY